MLESLSVGGGEVNFDESAGHARLTIPAIGRQYTNAQLDDYHGFSTRRFLGRVRFLSQPPLRLSLRARASAPAPLGTLGFGFWNEPFSISGGILSTPNAVWFFYASPPSDMYLVPGVPGRGWKAATVNTGRLPGLLVAPPAVVAVALTKIPGLGRPIMAVARRLIAAHETLLDDVALDEWHTYELEWRRGEARFSVDGTERMRSPAPPRGPLGFVMWIDNQYAIASAAGKFGFGVIPLPEPQWLEVEDFVLDRSPT